MKLRFILSFLFVCVLLTGCKNKVDLSGISTEVTLTRFDKEFYELKDGQLEQRLPHFYEKYTTFFDLYNERLLGISTPADPDYEEYLNTFFKNSVVKLAYNAVDSVFTPSVEEKLNKQITNAFKHFNYYFPNKLVPKIYTYIAGFNQSIVLTDSAIGVGLDKYLGQNYASYPKLGISAYMIANMYPEKIPSDCVIAWLLGEFQVVMPNKGDAENVLAKMIYKGKQLYVCEQLMPDENFKRIIGYDTDQLKWCKENEKNMWEFLIENKLLFSTDAFLITKLTEDAPHTAEFTTESPGRACNWLGYKIVSKYMSLNKDVTLLQLMENADYRDILEKARYNP